MKKNIKYFILAVNLLIFILITINVYTNHVMISDDIIYNFISGHINDKTTSIVKIITDLGDTLCLVIVTITSLILFRDKKINCSIIVNLVIITLLNNILKVIFMRQRPSLNVLVKAPGYSFPSGHSMISMAFYGYLIYLIYNHVKNKKLRWLFITVLSILILLIGVSRIYLGVHYATDVVGGFSFSIAYLIIYTQIVKKIIHE